MFQLSVKTLAGPGRIILNIIRACNLASFLTLIAMCASMMANMIKLSEFYFFEFAAHLIMALIAGFLFLSELDIYISFFAKHFPLFSYTHGLVFLGIVMIALGITVLGSLNDAAVLNSALGSSIYQLNLGAGALLLSLGFINIISSFILSNSSTNLTARKIRTPRLAAFAESTRSNNGPFGLATIKPANPSISDASTAVASTTIPHKTHIGTRFSKLVDRLTIKIPESHGSHPAATLPSYHNSPVPSSHYTGRMSDESNSPYKFVSGPLGGNPHLVGLERPGSAYAGFGIRVVEQDDRR